MRLAKAMRLASLLMNIITFNIVQYVSIISRHIMSNTQLYLEHLRPTQSLQRAVFCTMFYHNKEASVEAPSVFQ
jgi:hypothetical protein